MLTNKTDLAPDLSLENLQDEELDEEPCEGKREMAELEPLPEFAWAKNECCLWSNVGPVGDTQRKVAWGHLSPSRRSYLELEQTLANEHEGPARCKRLRKE